jgi:hypothetical protein
MRVVLCRATYSSHGAPHRIFIYSLILYIGGIFQLQEGLQYLVSLGYFVIHILNFYTGIWYLICYSKQICIVYIDDDMFCILRAVALS